VDILATTVELSGTLASRDCVLADVTHIRLARTDVGGAALFLLRHPKVGLLGPDVPASRLVLLVLGPPLILTRSSLPGSFLPELTFLVLLEPVLVRLTLLGLSLLRPVLLGLVLSGPSSPGFTLLVASPRPTLQLVVFGLLGGLLAGL
jgi:hypothetical protein